MIVVSTFKIVSLLNVILPSALAFIISMILLINAFPLTSSLRLKENTVL